MSEKNEETSLRTFRLRKTTIEGLKLLTNKLNEDLNIKLSMNAVVELLIKDAIKSENKKILKMIKKID